MTNAPSGPSAVPPGDAPSDEARRLIDRAVELARAGRDEEALELAGEAARADAGLAHAHYLTGVLHRRNGRLAPAIAAFERTLAVAPTHIDNRVNLADSLRLAGRHGEAAAVCRGGLALDPAHAGLLVNLGVALQAAGTPEAALPCYDRALRLDPDQPAVHNNLVRLHREAGRPAEAAALLRHALEHRPGDAGAAARRETLVTLLLEAGQPGAAAEAALAAMQAAPGDAGTAFRLGLLFLGAGRRDLALPCLRRTIRLAPQDGRHWAALGQALHGVRFAGADAELRQDLLAALAHPACDAADIAGAVGSVVAQAPAMAALIAADGDDGAAAALLADGTLARLAEDPLLPALLQTAIVADPVLERALTLLRRTLAAAAAGTGLPPAGDGSAGGGWAALCCALAAQCFANEYAYAEGAEEVAALTALAGAAGARLERGKAPAPEAVALIGAYRPLHRWPLAGRLLALPWPEPLARLLTLQVVEPLEEARLAGTLPALTAIRDGVSREVQAQYEENPYPRWLSLGLLDQPMPVPRMLRGILPSAPLPATLVHAPWDAPEVLVAGCGSGHEAVWAARHIAGARVLGIDLSRRSLAYAERKRRALGLDNLRLAQADLLEMPALGLRFDLIDCVGVLHHMADPAAGLRALAGMLTPQGVMKVGLYSATARRPVTEARALVAERGYPATAEGIRRLRQDILALPADDPLRTVARAPDFYSVSACRDLLLHVREVHATLPWLAETLEALGLVFLGFQFRDPAIPALYRRRFPQDPAMTALPLWHRLESEIPALFSGLYQFWVRPRG